MDTSHIASDNQLFPSSTPPTVPVTRLSYYGTAGQVFRLHLMNLFMNIITLGIYSFWGKTRIRRYMTSHVAVLNDRFEYTGTGKELLYGALKAMLIFLPLIIVMSIPVVNIFGFIAFFAILSVALYLALRYRLSRTKWRGIRFHLAGSVKEYFFLSLKRTIINIFTLGIKIPKSDIMRWSYIANHMSYGDLKFSYEGDSHKLKRIHLITLSILIVGFVAGFIPLVMAGYNAERAKYNVAPIEQTANSSIPADQEVSQIANQNEQTVSNRQGNEKADKKMVGGIIGMYLGIGIGLLSRLWYHAALWHEKFRGLRLANLRFKTDVTGKGLLKLYLTNVLIIIFTLGLGKPIAVHRMLRYYVTNMSIGGELKELIAHQESLQQTSGMGDALAADVGFDIGM